jgi:hypothetical protein
MNTPPITPDDQDWLDTLAGKPSGGTAKPATVREAMAVRRALQSIQETDASDAQFERTLFRLNQAGLLKRKPWWKQTSSWAIAASLMLVVGIFTQLPPQHTQKGDEADTLRGGLPHATVLLVENPELRLAELLQGLKDLQADARVERSPKGSITLSLAATPEVLDHLAQQRLEPEVKNGRVTLVLQKPQAPAAAHPPAPASTPASR